MYAKSLDLYRTMNCEKPNFWLEQEKNDVKYKTVFPSWKDILRIIQRFTVNGALIFHI